MSRFVIALLALLLCGPLTAVADVPPPRGQELPPPIDGLSGTITRVDGGGFEVNGFYVWTQSPPAALGIQAGDQVDVTLTRGGVRYFATTVERIRPDGSRESLLGTGR